MHHGEIDPLSLEYVVCDLCGRDDTAPLCGERGWRLVQCTACGLVYLNPRPAPAAMRASFDVYDQGHAASRPRDAKQVAGGSRRKGLLRRKTEEEVVLERVRRHHRSGRLLQIGCGAGAIVECMGRHGFDAHGVEMSSAAVARAHERHLWTIRQGGVRDRFIEARSFDVVLMLGTLEHEPRPSRMLEHACWLLRPGGHLLIRVPYYDSWNRRLRGRTWSGYSFPQHLYYYTPDTLARLVEKSGLRVVQNQFLDHVPLSDVMWLAAGERLGVGADRLARPLG